MSTTCCVSSPKFDVLVAKQLGDDRFNPARVAMLRGMYEDKYKTPIDLDDVPGAVEKLRSLISKNLGKSKKLKFKPNSNRAYRRLGRVFTSDELVTRINMLTNMFSGAVDNLRVNNPKYSREDLIRGKDGIGGEMAIFDEIYSAVLSQYRDARKEGNEERADKLLKIVDNWSALSTFVKHNLLFTEGLVLGNTIEFAEVATENGFSDNDLDLFYNPEEATRESWQNESGTTSAFGTVGAKVRRFLSTIPVLDEDGNVAVDDLGQPVYLNPVSAHQALLEILCGANDSNHMMDLLTDSNNNPLYDFLQPVINALNNDDQLRSAFFVDFAKNFVPYYKLSEKIENGITSVKTVLLNTRDNLLRGKAVNRGTQGHVIDSNVSIYDTDGKVIPDKLTKLQESLKEWLLYEESEEEKKKNKDLLTRDIFDAATRKKRNKYYTEGSTQVERKNFVRNSLEALGIEISADDLNAILSVRKTRNDVLFALSNLAKSGILERTASSLNRVKGASLSFKNLLQKKDSRDVPIVYETISKITNIISENTIGLHMESRIRCKNRKGKNITMHSHVNPNFMGDFFNKIEGYVKKNDKENLKKFLYEKYLSSSFYGDATIEDGKIKINKVYNKWLDELIKCCSEEAGPLYDNKSFASHFTYMRVLNKNNDRVFEDFTDSDYLMDMIAQFRSVETQSGGKTMSRAYYPVFVLGDAGVSKYIQGTRYSIEDIMKFMEDVYEQEKIRKQMVKDTDKYLKEKNNGVDKSGYAGIRNFRSTADRFSFLSFLNEDYAKGKYYNMLNEQGKSFKEVLTAYMEDSFTEFKSELEKSGLLDNPRTKIVDGEKVHTYDKLGQGVDSTNLDEVLKDYFFNSKFAMIQQLQLMTVDPSFYGLYEKGGKVVGAIKDLQKRYKEIHAPGTRLDVLAKWNGIEVCPTGKQTVVYFDDISTNAYNHNSRFMNVIGKKNSKFVSKYEDNTLTDGQGYRSLDSYRAVMVMAGKWNDRMEEAYNAIKQLRADFGYKNGVYEKPVPKERLEEIDNLAVVFQPIKPYLFTFENVSNGKGTDYMPVPVQHKYAEAVLIPELMREGKLRDMAVWMEQKNEKGEANADMICSTKAVKVGIFGETAITEASSFDELMTSLNKGYKHVLNFNDYRIQTNVPAHFNTAQLFGTQIRKLIMAGLNFNNDYSGYTSGEGITLSRNGERVPLNGKNLMSFWNSLIMANMFDSFEEFDKTITNKEALEEALSQGVLKNSRYNYDLLTAYSLDENGRFTSPLFEAAIEHDSAALITSLFKNTVNKQTIKGGSAVQVSSFGINGYTEDGDLKYITDENDENILYAECEIPFNFSYTDHNGNEVNLDFSEYCDNDGYLLDENNKPIKRGEDGKYDLSKSKLEKRFPGMSNIIAYRIPTEKEYSMMNLKAVRFTRMVNGGTIKMPPQGSVIAGYDFDIDKLYFMLKEFVAKPFDMQTSEKDRYDIFGEIYNSRQDIKELLTEAKKKYNDPKRPHIHQYWNEMLRDNPSLVGNDDYNKNKLFKEAAKKFFSEDFNEFDWETYDFDKTAAENSRVSRNNMMLDLMRGRLEDAETLKARTTPGGFANASASAKFNRFLTYGELAEIMTGRTVDVDNLYSKAENRDSADPEPEYDVTDPMTIIRYNHQNQIASKLIGIFANANTNYAFSTLTESITLKEGLSLAFSDRVGENELRDLRNVSYETAMNMAEFLAASVDAVKDPVLNYLNLNEVTADAGAILARLGYNMKEIGLLFNQPIIKELCDICQKENTFAKVAVEQLIKKYTSKEFGARAINKKKGEKRDTENLTSEILANNIVAARMDEGIMNDPSFATAQLEILDLFDDILSVTEAMSQFTLSTKFTASNSVGSTMGALYSQQMRVESFIEKQLDSPVKIVASKENSAVLFNDKERLNMDKHEYIESMLWSPFGYEQLMYDLERKCLKTCEEYFPYETASYSQAREALKILSYGNTITEDIINQIHQDMITYLLSRQTNSLFNGDRKFKDMPKGCSNVRDYYRNFFPTIAMNILEIDAANCRKTKKTPLTEKYAILKYLTMEDTEYMDDRKNEFLLKVVDPGGMDSQTRAAIMQSWADMINSEDATEKKLAQDLFFYCFHRLGFGFSPVTFMNLVPTEVKEKIEVFNNDNVSQSYIDFCNDVLEGKAKGFSLNDFVKQFLCNHFEHKRFSTTVSTRTENDAYKYILKNRDNGQSTYPKSFNISVDSFGEDGELRAKFLQRSKKVKVSEKRDEEHFVYKPVIKLDTGSSTIYYVCNVLSDTTTRKVTYNRVEALGTTNRLLTYTNTTTDGGVFDRTTAIEAEEAASTKRTVDPIMGTVMDNDTEINRGEMVLYGWEDRPYIVLKEIEGTEGNPNKLMIMNEQGQIEISDKPGLIKASYKYSTFAVPLVGDIVKGDEVTFTENGESLTGVAIDTVDLGALLGDDFGELVLVKVKDGDVYKSYQVDPGDITILNSMPIIQPAPPVTSDSSVDSFSVETETKIDDFLAGYNEPSVKFDRSLAIDILTEVFSEIDNSTVSKEEYKNRITDIVEDRGNNYLRAQFNTLAENNYKDGKNVFTLSENGEEIEVC